MNTQDILRHGRIKFDAILDFSEYYDYELEQTYPICQLDTRIDVSELYDYEVVDKVLGKVDAVLDYSEYYDFALGDNTVDYIYYEKFPCIFHFLLTEDGCIMNTEDNCKLEYEQNGIM